MIRKHVRYNFMVLLNRLVQNAWLCVMDRYRNVCVWFMARNCWFPNRLPLQGTAGSQRMELFVPNLGTRVYHFKQLPVPRGWNSLLPTWEPQVTIARNCRSQRMELLVPNLGARGYHCKQLPVPRGWNSRFPTWEPQVTIARNCRFPKVGTLCRQRGNHSSPLQGTAGSQRLELTLPNLGTTGYHCKELPVPRGWNSWFPTWEPWVTIASNC